jgi:hypothetical protein
MGFVGCPLAWQDITSSSCAVMADELTAGVVMEWHSPRLGPMHP